MTRKEFDFDYRNIGENCNYRGYTFMVEIDEHPESPREWDNLSHYICDNNRYICDKNAEDELTDYLCELFPSKSDEIEWLNASNLIYFAMENIRFCVYRNIDRYHSGLFWISEKEIRKEYNCKRISKRIADIAMKVLEGESDAYVKYCNGDVYRFAIYSETGEMIDSCCGFYGDKEIFSEIKTIIDYDIEHKRNSISEIQNEILQTISFC